jgi:hypothetical protein
MQYSFFPSFEFLFAEFSLFFCKIFLLIRIIFYLAKIYGPPRRRSTENPHPMDIRRRGCPPAEFPPEQRVELVERALTILEAFADGMFRLGPASLRLGPLSSRGLRSGRANPPGPGPV